MGNAGLALSIIVDVTTVIIREFGAVFVVSSRLIILAERAVESEKLRHKIPSGTLYDTRVINLIHGKVGVRRAGGRADREGGREASRETRREASREAGREAGR